MCDGSLQAKEELNNNNIGKTNGMMICCNLKNGKSFDGYSDSYRLYDESYDSKVNSYIFLNNYKYYDSKNNKFKDDVSNKYEQSGKKININDIDSIDAILYSNPRWGGRILNKFEFYHTDKSMKLVDVTIPSFLKSNNNMQ